MTAPDRTRRSSSYLDVAKIHVDLARPDTEPDTVLEDALNFPGTLARKKDVSFTVMIDGFQELLKWGDAFVQLFRKVMQAHENVSYILAGSAPTVMRGLVYDSKSPFYRQLTDIRIGKLAGDEVAAFVKRRLASAGLGINKDAADRLFDLSRGHADYVQRLGMEVFLRCLNRTRKPVSSADVDAAYDDMLLKLDADFGNAFERHTDLEREILIALANSISTFSAISVEIRKPPSSLPRTMGRLIASDVVERYMPGRYRLVDGVFEDWIKNRDWGLMAVARNPCIWY